MIRLRREWFRIYHARMSPHPLLLHYGRMKFYIMSNSPISELWYSGIGFEEKEMRFLKKIVKQGDFVMDIGANIGIYTLFFSDLVGINGHVWSFEPSPFSVSLLRENVAMNFLQNVSVVEEVLTDKTGQVEFYVFEGTGDVYNSIGAITRPVEKLSADKAIIVKSTTVDDFAEENKINKVDIIKIDVEGAEELVLRGAKKMLGRSNNVVVMLELYEPSLKQCGSSVEGIVSFMKGLGFGCWGIKDNGRLCQWGGYEGGTSYVVFKKR